MRRATPAAFGNGIAQGLIGTFLVAAIFVALCRIAAAYLDPALRKAIIYSGFGMC